MLSHWYYNSLTLFIIITKCLTLQLWHELPISNYLNLILGFIWHSDHLQTVCTNLLLTNIVSKLKSLLNCFVKIICLFLKYPPLLFWCLISYDCNFDLMTCLSKGLIMSSNFHFWYGLSIRYCIHKHLWKIVLLQYKLCISTLCSFTTRSYILFLIIIKLYKYGHALLKHLYCPNCPNWTKMMKYCFF